MKTLKIVISVVVCLASKMALADQAKLQGPCAQQAASIADQLASIEDNENGTQRTLDEVHLSQHPDEDFPGSGVYYVNYTLANVKLEHQVTDRSFVVILNSDCSPNLKVKTQNSRQIPGLLR